MVQINFAQKSVNDKIVYYGPGMSGKTTNLEVVHQRAPDGNRGDLTSISTDGDRTLFFDFMPLDLGTVFHPTEPLDGRRVGRGASGEIVASRRKRPRLLLDHHGRTGIGGLGSCLVAVATIGGSPAGLHIGGIPAFGAHCAQKGRRVEGTGAHLHVQRLQYHAALAPPELLES